MRTILEVLICFPIGIALGIWLSAAVAIPIFYGFPRSLWLALRGELKFRAPFFYLIFPIGISFGMIFALVALSYVLPGVYEFIRSSAGLNWGSIFGFWSAPLSLLVPSNRRDLDKDFWSVCAKLKK